MKKIKLSDEVIFGKNNGLGLVALESTLISHGLPYPENVIVANAAEAAVRASGSIPATIAVMDGTAKIGLEAIELERLAKAKSVLKLSRRNLPLLLADTVNAPALGATTVSATMILAQRAGIKLFATGGIGGVHRGVTESMDISADLFELAHTSVAVVCSGPKVILDLWRTRECLETMGVTVIGYGCDEMPAFWARSSGIAVDCRVDSPSEAAALIRARDDLGIGGAVLICNPVTDDLAIEMDTIEGWIKGCIDAAPEGAGATPWLLAEIAKRSDGRSIAANKQLIVDNAGLAGTIAAAL